MIATRRGNLITRRSHALVGGILVIVAGCSSNSASPLSQSSGLERTPTTSPASSASTDPSASAAIAPEAAVFGPDAISSGAEEYRISFMPNGQTAYFARGDGFFPQTQEATIMESRLLDGEWTEPIVAPFSGTYPDIDPWVSPDGQHIYFSSIRPVEGEDRTDAEVWRVDRDGNSWSEPVHLASVGSDSDELGASITADGVLWFASERTGGAGGWDLYSAEPDGDDFAAPTPVEDFNTDIWEFNPAISADGNLLVFTSIHRPGGSGLGDLFVATRGDDGWTAEEPVAVNTPADEYHASFSPDGATLHFVRRGVDGDLYEVAWPTP